MDATLLKASFNLVEPQKDEFAAAFYQRLFDHYPATQEFFARTDMKQQERTLVATLAFVVAGVEKGENLTPVLQQLGARHVKYGVSSEHYPIVGQMLIETFQDMLGPEWTPAYEEAWLQAYTTIVKTMLS